VKKPLQILFLLLLLIAQTTISNAQNLVPNPSFEEYTLCPDYADQVNYSTGWSSYGNSPDYFNSCAITPTVSVPFNFGGYQIAASGNAYCGISTYVSPVLLGVNNYREYIGRMLSSNLIIGTKYYVSLKANCMNINNIGPSNCTSNNLGVKFSNAPYNPDNPPVTNISQIYSNTLITDTINWIRIFGSFISDSTYHYIIIGNFFDDNHTDTLILDGDSLCRGAYYYIDDICVSTDSAYSANYTSINEPVSLQYFSINPNPATNYLNIDFPSLATLYYLDIFDSFGRIILKQKINEKYTILDITDFSKGVFFIKISFNNQVHFYKLFKL